MPRSELVENWRVLAGCVLAMTVGVIALPGAAVAIFMSGLEAEFGWSRTAISAAPSILLGMVVVMSPFVGWLSDRAREAKILAVGISGIGVSFLLFSRIGGDIRLFLAGFALMAVVGSAASTVPLARIINANFDRSRGFALGLAMVGTGLSSMLLPLLLVPFAAANGWRAGFIALGIVALVAVPVILFLLRGARHADREHAGPATLPAGIPLAEAVRGRPFWLMAVSFALITLGAGGIQVHFYALLADAGVTPTRAGVIASVSGATLIVVRVTTGWLIDRLFAPYVAAAMMAAAGICMALLGLIGAPVAVLGAIAYGLAIGAEIDIIGYVVARYFGMRAYGRIYGILYAAVLVGATFSPLMYGITFDRLGTYQPAMYGSAVLLIVSSILLLLLPRFPASHGAREAPVSEEGGAGAELPRE
ncbi:MAG: MFS transporter [Sphingomicrobium sp.]